MDGFSGATSVIAVIDISVKIASLCFQYSVAVKDAEKDIERLQRKVADLKEVLKGVEQLLESKNKSRLSAAHTLAVSLSDCFLRLQEVKNHLDPGKSRKAMSRLGVRALKWPFTSKEVEKTVFDLEKYEQTFIIALQVDQTGLILDLDQKMNFADKKTDDLHQKIDLAKLPIAKGASFNSHMEEHNARCLENTRVELKRYIAEWARDSNGKPMFWLNGMAGTGKSTIARTVAQSLAEIGQLGASFFFKKGEGDRGNAARFFTTIATDLMVRIPELRPEIRKALDADPAISERALKHQFEMLILRPLSEQILQGYPQDLKLIIVIDALDECDQEEDVRAIIQLLAQTKDITPVSLRVFLTSRPEFPIRFGFKQMSDKTYQDLILHEVPKQTIEQDITLFLEHELEEIRERRSLPQHWPGKDKIQALVEMAIPLFIFAATACRYIGDQRGNPKQRLDIVLQYQTAPHISKLDRTYLPILNQLFDNDEDEIDQERQISEFREIVGSIVALKSPLSVVSLARFLGFPREDIHCRLDLLHSVLSIPVDENMPVMLLHLSFRDFLFDPQKHGKSPFWVDERKTHEKLTSKCIQLMSSSKGLKQNICNLLSPGTLRSEIDKQTIDHFLQPEVQYACRYWVHHLEQSKKCIRDGDPVYAFLQKCLLYWLEAMSLIREVSESIRMINSLQSLVDSDKSTEISDFLHDTKRFVLRNRSILEDAPLQLYSSALIFAPEMSIIRKRFNCHIPHWTTLLSKVERDWNASLQTLEGHSERVTAVAFSSDGRLVASGSSDDTVRLWDAAMGSCHSTLEGHLQSITAVAFSPDGKLVASGSFDGTARLWDVATGSCRSTLVPLSSNVCTVAFSPDGKLVASGSFDGTARLWDVATGSCRGTLRYSSKLIKANIAFLPDGQLIASECNDCTARLWDVATGSCRSTLKGHLQSIRAVAFSPDGKLVASGSVDDTARLWDLATGSCRSTLEGHLETIITVAFSPDGKLVASGSFDGTARLWDVATGSCRSTLEGLSSDVRTVAFSPDGQLVASFGSDDNTVRLWDVVTGSCRSILEGHLREVCTMAFSSDGRFVASGSEDNTVRLWDAATRSCRSTLVEGHSDWINAMAFSPDGQLVVSGSLDGTVRLWDAATGSCRSTLEGYSEGFTTVAFSPDGQLVVSSGSDYNTLWLWDVMGSCRSILEGHSHDVRTVAFSPDGKLVASGSFDDTVRLWDVATGSCRSTLEGHLETIITVAFSPDGKLVASGSFDGTARLWDVATGTCRSTLEGHSKVINTVAFSLDNQLVASGSDDRTVRLWDVATGFCRSTLEGHSHDVHTVAFSPDGQLVASGSLDGTVRLWDVAMGSFRSTVKAGSKLIKAMAFSPDGSYLTTNRGQISLPSHLSDSFPSQKREPCFIFVEDQWITSAEQRLLWLPVEYRPTSMDVRGNSIWLGHASGNITILKFNFESMPWQNKPTL